MVPDPIDRVATADLPTAARARELLPQAQGGCVVIVVTYTARDRLERCLNALRRTRGDYSLLVVDNGSPYNAAAWVAEEWPEARTLRLEQNSGYTGGANAGLKTAIAAGASQIAILNDDAEVITDDWLEAGIGALRDRYRAGVVGYRCVEDTVTGFNDHEPAAQPSIVSSTPTSVVTYERVHSINGFAAVFSAALLRSIGLFDETYFVYADEDDLLARVRRSGHEILECSIPLRHHPGSTTGRFNPESAYMQMRNGIRCALKNRGWLGAFAKFARLLDIAANPWPLLYRPDDAAHRRSRSLASRAEGLRVLSRATRWNLSHADESVRVARAERAASRRLRDRGPVPPDVHFSEDRLLTHLPESVIRPCARRGRSA